MDGRQAEKEESKGDAQIIYFPRAHVETWVYERVWQGQSCPWKPCLDIATQVGAAGLRWGHAHSQQSPLTLGLWFLFSSWICYITAL